MPNALLDVFGRPARASSDRDLAGVVAFLRPFFNPYDIIVRMSSEQLLCFLTGYELAAVTERFALIRAGLARAAPAALDRTRGRAGYRAAS